MIKSPKVPTLIALSFCLLFVIFLILTLISCSTEKSYYKGQKSDHFNGKVFFNHGDSEIRNDSFFQYFRAKKQYLLKNGKQQWPSEISQNPTMINVPLKIIDDGKVHVTFIGHSTFLLQLEGLNIVTDPIWSKTAGPTSFLDPKRSIAPGINFNDLPKIDAVLISHSHYDHLDIPTVKMLKTHSNPIFFAGLGICHYLNNVKNLNVKCVEMDWNNYATIGELKIHFLEAKHWSKRAIFGSNVTLWGAFVLESRLGNIYFTGDTGYGDHFKKAAEKFDTFKLSLISIGAYKPLDFMHNHHLSPEEAVMVHLDLNSTKSIAMHFDTFKLGLENYNDAVKGLAIAKGKYHIKNDGFMVMNVGDEETF